MKETTLISSVQSIHFYTIRRKQNGNKLNETARFHGSKWMIKNCQLSAFPVNLIYTHQFIMNDVNKTTC